MEKTKELNSTLTDIENELLHRENAQLERKIQEKQAPKSTESKEKPQAAK